MWNAIQSFLSQDHIDKEELKNDHELKISIAALLVNVASEDHVINDIEHGQLMEILVGHFDLDDDEAASLIQNAQDASEQAVDLHKFVSVINADFDNDQRKDILKYAWQVVLADGIINNYEDNLMRKLGPLLGISRHESIAIRDRVATECGAHN